MFEKEGVCMCLRKRVYMCLRKRGYVFEKGVSVRKRGYL